MHRGEGTNIHMLRSLQCNAMIHYIVATFYSDTAPINWTVKCTTINDCGISIKYSYRPYKCRHSQGPRQCLYKVSSRWCTHLGGDREYTNIYKTLLILLLSSHIAWHRDIILAPNWLARGWGDLLFQTHVNYFQIVAKKINPSPFKWMRELFVD